MTLLLTANRVLPNWKERNNSSRVLKIDTMLVTVSADGRRLFSFLVIAFFDNYAQVFVLDDHIGTYDKKFKWQKNCSLSGDIFILFTPINFLM